MNFTILRKESPEISAHWQTIAFDADETMTIASVLTALNQIPDLKDIEGNPVKLPIRWESSCLQKKCGACAMVINGKPSLACDVRISALMKCNEIKIEPLRKFPIVADLIVDRSILFENLKALKLWFDEITDTEGEIAYEASRCLQCGCCLEVCPNFYAGGEFFGMSAFVPISRILTNLPESQKKEICYDYKKHLYEGCGKSLACRNICPAGIDIDRLLVNSNAVAVWKRFFRK